LLFPAVCLAQTVPTIGILDYYGVRNVPPAEIVKVLAVAEGSRLPASKGELEERLESIDGVVAARIEAACCEDGKAILYVGIEEKGAPRFDHRDPPDGEIKLPDAVTAVYREFLDAVRAAGQGGATAEDLTHGHSLMADSAVRAVQLKFIPLANEHTELIRQVLRTAADAEHRAIAAYVIGYAKDKPSVHDDLQHALSDADDTVRANAMRSLAAFAVLSRMKPDSGVKVSPTWLIEMLNSLIWTDRNNAAVALVTLTENRDESTLDQLRTRAQQSLIDMARWKHMPHALPAFILLGRTAGMSEAEIQSAWSNGDREAFVKASIKAATSKKQ
jgi:hypothetical protein